MNKPLGRQSPTLHTWLTHRLSYLRRPAHISWGQMQAQFGSNFQDTKQGRRKFRLDFEKQLAKVLAFYRDARVATTPEQLVLLPSRPHVSPPQAPVAVVAIASLGSEGLHDGRAAPPRCRPEFRQLPAPVTGLVGRERDVAAGPVEESAGVSPARGATTRSSSDELSPSSPSSRSSAEQRLMA